MLLMIDKFQRVTPDNFRAVSEAENACDGRFTCRISAFKSQITIPSTTESNMARNFSSDSCNAFSDFFLSVISCPIPMAVSSSESGEKTAVVDQRMVRWLPDFVTSWPS